MTTSKRTKQQTLVKASRSLRANHGELAPCVSQNQWQEGRVEHTSIQHDQQTFNTSNTTGATTTNTTTASDTTTENETTHDNNPPTYSKGLSFRRRLEPFFLLFFLSVPPRFLDRFPRFFFAPASTGYSCPDLELLDGAASPSDSCVCFETARDCFVGALLPSSSSTAGAEAGTTFAAALLLRFEHAHTTTTTTMMTSAIHPATTSATVLLSHWNASSLSSRVPLPSVVMPVRPVVGTAEAGDPAAAVVGSSVTIVVVSSSLPSTVLLLVCCSFAVVAKGVVPTAAATGKNSSGCPPLTAMPPTGIPPAVAARSWLGVVVDVKRSGRLTVIEPHRTAHSGGYTNHPKSAAASADRVAGDSDDAGAVVTEGWLPVLLLGVASLSPLLLLTATATSSRRAAVNASASSTHCSATVWLLVQRLQASKLIIDVCHVLHLSPVGSLSIALQFGGGGAAVVAPRGGDGHGDVVGRSADVAADAVAFTLNEGPATETRLDVLSASLAMVVFQGPLVVVEPPDGLALTVLSTDAAGEVVAVLSEELPR